MSFPIEKRIFQSQLRSIGSNYCRHCVNKGLTECIMNLEKKKNTQGEEKYFYYVNAFFKLFLENIDSINFEALDNNIIGHRKVFQFQSQASALRDNIRKSRWEDTQCQLIMLKLDKSFNALLLSVPISTKLQTFLCLQNLWISRSCQSFFIEFEGVKLTLLTFSIPKFFSVVKGNFLTFLLLCKLQ